MRNVECGMRNVKDARKETDRETEKIDRDREER